MTEQILQASNVRSTLQQMRGKRMTQRVTGSSFAICVRRKASFTAHCNPIHDLRLDIFGQVSWQENTPQNLFTFHPSQNGIRAD